MEKYCLYLRTGYLFGKGIRCKGLLGKDKVQVMDKESTGRGIK